MGVRFDAANEYYTRSSFGATVWSACAWFRKKNAGNSGTIVSVGNYNQAHGYVMCSSGGGMSLWSNLGGWQEASFGAVGDDEWAFVGLVRNGTSLAGWMWQLDSGYDDSTSITDSGSATPADRFHIGESFYGGEWLDGVIYAVKLWSGRALTQAELEWEMWKTRPRLRIEDLYGFYPLLDTSSGQVDFSGNGNSLTAGGGASDTGEQPLIPWGLTEGGVFVPASGTAYTRSVTETAEAGETLARAWAAKRAVTEEAEASETVTRVSAAARAVAEIAAATETVQQLSAAARAVTETAGAIESVARGLARAVSESVAAGETVARSAAYTRALSETGAALETLLRQLDAVRSVLESVDAEETVDYVHTPGGGGTAYVRAVTEAVQAVETAGRVVASVREVLETANADESSGQSAAYERTEGETAEADETTVGSQGWIRGVSETAEAGETALRSHGWGRPVTEGVDAGETAASLQALSRSVEEVAQATELARRVVAFYRARAGVVQAVEITVAELELPGTVTVARLSLTAYPERRLSLTAYPEVRLKLRTENEHRLSLKVSD